MKHPNRRRQQGLTLVEAATALAIVGILAGAAAPSLQDLRERSHVESVAAELETDIQLARGAAVLYAEGVRLSFQDTRQGSCYIVHTGDADACECGDSGPAVCKPGTASLRTVRVGRERPVRLDSNADSMFFEHTRGTVTPTATIQVIGPGGHAMHQVVNLMGRVRSCVPGGGWTPYKAC